MKIFKLEEYLTEYEFNAPYLLCCSDAESFSMKDILQLADKNDKKLWDNLSLGYTETYGMMLLREQIAISMYEGLSAENILCFAGAAEGIYSALYTICEPKDHVIVLTPCYQSLLEIPLLKGSKVTEIPLLSQEDWRINLDSVRNSLKSNTKVIVINFPHNPTGQVITQDELNELVSICDRHGIWIFSDEVYRLLGEPQGGFSKPVGCMYDKAISLGVMSKAFGMAGLRVGWIACQDKEMLHKIKQVKNYLSICNSAPAEIISLIALKNKDYILERNNKIVRENLILLDHFIQEEYCELFSWVIPSGGCVGFVHYKGKEQIDTFCKKLVENAGVLLLPASVYDYPEKYFRIGFGRKNMPNSLEKLREYISIEL